MATAATARFARVSRVDRQRAAADFRAIALRNGWLSVLVAYATNAKPFG
jgi:hypothetical protein